MAKQKEITRKRKEAETAREYLRRILHMPKRVVRELNVGAK